METNHESSNSVVSIGGEGATQVEATNIAGGDISIENNHYETKNGFADINLLPYSSEYYVVPQFAEQLVLQLKSNHLLLITGSFGFDKETFVRHLSYRLSELLPGLKAKEWNAPTDSIENMAKDILEEKTPSIFIVNRIGPKDVDFDLDKIKRNAEQMSHYVLLTSDLAIATWQQPEHTLRKHWFEIPDQNLYSKDVLLQILIDLINKNRTQLSFETSFENADSETSLTSKHTIRKLSEAFNTPEQIIFFIEMLTMEDDKLSAKKLDELLGKLKDNKESMITKWFRSLSEKEKLLILGASLFEGLYEDQFFQVMQKVTQEFWHHKNPDLFALDYGDLDFALNFFKFEEYSSSVSIFKGKFPNQRADIIRAAWNSHRRHIITSLPILVEIGSQSGTGSTMNKGLNSSRERGMALRSMIAELFSDIAMISIQLVEERLLEFAVVANDTLQRVTAKALARWRLFGKEQLLFETLERWQRDQKIRSKVVDMAPKNTAAAEKILSNLGSTILMTIRYAAEYDSQDHLHPAILERLTDIASERNPILNDSLGKVLTILISKHYGQLKNILPDELMTYAELDEYLTKGIITAYEKDPDEVKNLVTYWYNIALQKPDHPNERILIHVLRIYQKLPYTGTNDCISIQSVWEHLQFLYTLPLQSETRNSVLETIGICITIDPEFALDQLEKLFNYSTLQEREILFSSFVKVYTEQREKLEGADYTIEVNGTEYPSFINKVRPLTGIEKTLYNWLKGDNQFAQQIALLTFIRFAKDFDLAANRAIPKPIRTHNWGAFNAQRSSSDNFIVKPNISPVTLYEPEMSFLNMIRIWWWLLFESPKDRIIFRSLLSGILQHKDLFNLSDAVYVTQKMKAQSEERLSKIGGWMEKWVSKILQ